MTFKAGEDINRGDVHPVQHLRRQGQNERQCLLCKCLAGWRLLSLGMRFKVKNSFGLGTPTGPSQQLRV